MTCSIRQSRPAGSCRCPRMSAYILNIFIVKVNRAKRTWFFPHDSGIIKVIRRILLYRIIHSAEGITPQICGNAFRVFEYRKDIVQATKGAQSERQWNGVKWGKNFLSGWFLSRKLWSLTSQQTFPKCVHSFLHILIVGEKSCILWMRHSIHVCIETTGCNNKIKRCQYVGITCSSREYTVLYNKPFICCYIGIECNMHSSVGSNSIVSIHTHTHTHTHIILRHWCCHLYRSV
jgi:hypothetical protein